MEGGESSTSSKTTNERTSCHPIPFDVTPSKFRVKAMDAIPEEEEEEDEAEEDDTNTIDDDDLFAFPSDDDVDDLIAQLADIDDLPLGSNVTYH